MGSLMTSQGRSDVNQSEKETGDARQASVMMSEGQVRDGLQWRHRWERNVVDERERQTGVVRTRVFIMTLLV